MTELTGIERVSRQLKHLPVDRIAAHEAFWRFTMASWAKQGRVEADENPIEHFKLDIDVSWVFDLKVEPGREPDIVEEDEETITAIDGNGARMRRHKQHDSTPEHLGYAVNNREEWESFARDRLKPLPARLNIGEYRARKEACRAANRFFCWAGVNVFEAIHPLCGHENLLMGMALDPDWIRDMAEVYSDLFIALWEELFALEGKPDGLYFFEDLGFRGRPFMSPEMYRELLMPAHRKTFEFAHSQGIPVIMHSCGFIEPLLPDIVAAGIDCLQAMEVKAGMDLLRIYQNFGEKIALMGGLDVRPVANNDLDGIRRELESKIPLVKGRNGFILHSDHSIPESADYESYRYFLETGLELGRY